MLQAILDEFARRHDDVAAAIMDEMGAPWGLARGAQALSGPQHFKAAIKIETIDGNSYDGDSGGNGAITSKWRSKSDFSAFFRQVND